MNFWTQTRKSQSESKSKGCQQYNTHVYQLRVYQVKCLKQLTLPVRDHKGYSLNMTR